MKNLGLLIKLQKTKVDEQRVILARLQDNLDKIKDTLVSMEQEFEKEQKIAKNDYESMMTYEKYLKKFMHDKKETEKQLVLMEEAVLLAHDKLTELFEEQKRYEIALEQKLEEERLLLLKLENQALDETGSIWHQRKKI